jgi:L-ribulose-5-phosphate 4-epimerase
MKGYMMHRELKERVWQANQHLVKNGLVMLTWGNVSGIDREQGIVAIKPSGVSYQILKTEDIVVVDMNGGIIEGKLNPSSDTSTHLALYHAFKEIKGITHTHSTYATMFSQACREIPCLGTTHADNFADRIPLTRFISEEELDRDYEASTGQVIIERFININPMEIPAVLVAGHGPFTWGASPEKSVENSIILEQVAKMALGTLQLNSSVNPLPGYILKKHYLRKHGKDAYYGQKGHTV